MKIALLQMPVTASKQENLDTAARYIKEAAANGARLAVLPEMFCCPYTNDAFVAYAEEGGCESWERMAACAKEAGITLVAGSIPEKESGRIYNSSMVFNPQGERIARHRKMHLFDIDIKGGQRFKESDTFTPGDEVVVFEADGVKMGLCICFDMRFPELARLLVQKGAQVIVCPAAFNMTTGPMHWELMFRQRAVDNQVYTLGAAPARDVNGPYVSYGNSIVCSPWGKVLARAGAEPEILYADLDMDEVAKVREQLPLLSARRTDLYRLEEI